MKEISLRPYNGRLFVVFSKKKYEKAHRKLFKSRDELTCAQQGRFVGGCGIDGMWTYLAWSTSQHTLVHEMGHVVLHLFERCGIDPREGNGEPFCYMLAQIVMEANMANK